MNAKAFKFNSKAKYHSGLQKTAARDVGDLRKGLVRVQSDDLQKFFETKYPDIFKHYLLPLTTSNDRVQSWHSHPMQFWQNQLNFAVWCATIGCGVSVEDHLTPDDDLLKSVYRIHVYYQTRRILMEMQAPLPKNRAWDAVNNPYDRQEYERICDKFGVSPHSDWRVHGPSQGLGLCYNHMHGHDHKVGNGDYDPRKMSFADHVYDVRVNYIKQEDSVARAWRLFILNKSDGLTQPGVERLNGSILTYIWAVLGAQAQVRTEILGVGPAFNAQSKFLSNVESAIADPVDISEAVECYQNSVQYARSEVSFSF